MSQIVVAQRMWQRRDTAANWSAANPVLAAGEIGVELGAGPDDTQFKIGTGSHPWNDLPYYAAGGGGGGDDGPLNVVDEPSVFTATPGVHEGRGTYVRAGGGVIFDSGEGYETGHIFNIRATGEGALAGAGVVLTPPAGGSLVLSEDMAVTVVFVGPYEAEVIGQTAGASSSVDAKDVFYDNTGSGLAAATVQAAIDEVVSSSGSSSTVAVITESSAFTATVSEHAGLGRYIRASGNVVFDSGEGYVAGQVFNVRALSSLSLVGSGVSLNPTYGTTLDMEAGMAVTVIMVSPFEADVIGLGVAE